jgi:(2Fe-2S) ferredoxin
MAIKDLIQTKKCIFICNGSCCIKKDAEEITLAIRKNIKERDLQLQYHTIRTKCMGRCDDAPVAMVAPDNVWIKSMNTDDCNSLVEFIQQQTLKQSNYFLYQMGEQIIKSDSIPTIYRTKNEL